MKKLLIICWSLLAISVLNAQNFAGLTNEILANVSSRQQQKNTDEEAPIPLFTLRGSYPQFPGGETALVRYIQEHIEFPELARSHGHEGTVVVQFVVGVDGKVGLPEVIKGVGLGCDEAALAVFKDMPIWKPALQAGRPVAVKYITPVKFRLF